MVQRNLILSTSLALILVPACTWARDGHVIKLPKRSELTPVQRLNREGVEDVKKRDYHGAEERFYKAYLYDPADPFTLNNLGYISELEGDLDRAQRFYGLAAEQSSNATIDLSNAKHLEGRPMQDALVNLNDAQMRVNHTNIQAMQLLAQGRGLEALALLRQTLSLDTRNPFTLNNLGVASEATGDYDGALSYYRQAAAVNSSEPAAVALDRSWRGHSVSEMASASAQRLERRIQSMGPNDERAVMMTVHGVLAANKNDWSTAREDFLRAYSLDPTSAFTMNNRGWVAEKDGDLESAQYFYRKAQQAENSSATVGFATRAAAEGKSLNGVAADSNNKVDDALDIYSRERQHEQANPELVPRGNSTTPTHDHSPTGQQQP